MLTQIPFGIDLSFVDIDEFLMSKITRKLQYWSSTFLCLTAQAIVINSVLLSTLWYFLAIWGGTTHVVKRIKTKLNNYLWKESAKKSRIRVSWQDCTVLCQKRGLNLVDPEIALQALLAKWIVKALLPGNSNLQILLRHKLFQIRPHGPGRWSGSLRWYRSPSFHARNTSTLWNRTILVELVEDPDWRSVYKLWGGSSH